MSAHKIKGKDKVILDLTNKKLDYNRVYSRINKLRVVKYAWGKEGLFSTKNLIKIGRYSIVISDSSGSINKTKGLSIKYLALNDFLCADILENSPNGTKPIKIGLIEDQTWVNSYLKRQVTLQELSNMILFCNRLDSLNPFS